MSWNVCPVCVRSWSLSSPLPSFGDPIEEVAECSTCRNALDRQAKGCSGDSDSVWLRHLADRRATLRSLEESGGLDKYPYHPWHALHEIGQDYDQIVDGAIAHEEAKRNGQ